MKQNLFDQFDDANFCLSMSNTFSIVFKKKVFEFLYQDRMNRYGNLKKHDFYRNFLVKIANMVTNWVLFVHSLITMQK